MFVDLQLQHIDPVVAVGDTAVFTCLLSFSTLVSVEWLVNGTSLNSSQLHDVELAFIAKLGVIRFNNVSADYNNTRIQCLATSSTNEMMLSRTSTFRLQGI